MMRENDKLFGGEFKRGVDDCTYFNLVKDFVGADKYLVEAEVREGCARINHQDVSGVVDGPVVRVYEEQFNTDEEALEYLRGLLAIEVSRMICHAYEAMRVI